MKDQFARDLLGVEMKSLLQLEGKVVAMDAGLKRSDTAQWKLLYALLAYLGLDYDVCVEGDITIRKAASGKRKK